MFDKVLIANRGAIACRIIRTLRRMGIGSVAVYSDVDRYSMHVRLADESVALGGSAAADSYLRQDKLLDAARATCAKAIHPGCGFLSEDAPFAENCDAHGIVFIGPTPAQIRDFGLEHRARALAQEHGLPLLPGNGQKHVERARHIQVQLFGDGAGNVIALGERDCSSQRRNQKLIGETPVPGLPAETRAHLLDAAVRLGRGVGYRSAGTVEFVCDVQTGEFYFLEVNTCLQMEHGVTEEVTGVDLVEWMVRAAGGDPPNLAEYRYAPKGHSIEAQLYAEDPARNFRASSGLLSHVVMPGGVRVDGCVEPGSEVSSFYDPMLATIIAHGETRELALAALEKALAETSIYGVETNLDYERSILAQETFRSGRQDTQFLSTFEFPARSVEVLKPGTHSTVQEYPGRLGCWSVGVPPSGPMDALAFRLANRIVGNREWHAALELTGTGPSLKFGVETMIALAGAQMTATIDGKPVPYWQPVTVPAGAVLSLGAIHGAGQRTYLAVKGGFVVPPYLGSKATFTLGQFGGHVGRALRTGDVLRLSEPDVMRRFMQSDEAPDKSAPAPTALIPKYGKAWNIAVTPGPHAVPDVFTEKDIRAFYDAEWEVHYTSSRAGVGLIGPKPKWARRDGGEAGLHPSNILDNAYAVGAVNYTRDMPVILGPDGPSVGGFVCPAVVAVSDLWKLGQLRPGDRIRFYCIGVDAAVARRQVQDELITGLERPHGVIAGGGDAAEDDVEPVQGTDSPLSSACIPSSILYSAGTGNDAVCVRQSGEDCILIEFGPPVLDLELRFRVHALMQALEAKRLSAIIDLAPGIRSLQMHYDSRALSQSKALDLVLATHSKLPAPEDIEVPSRIVHLPLSWDDPATRAAIAKYMQSVRADAPSCPSNIEFIRRGNGLGSIEDVKRIVFEASYLVTGLGNGYLGAPVATPLDPRHRLVTTQYNPARTQTPENAVAIAGACLRVYGLEAPGGDQLVGRTVQMWNRYRQTADFSEGKQWLLRFFDQIRFYPVSADELLKMREDFPQERFTLRIEKTTLKLVDHRTSSSAP